MGLGGEVVKTEEGEGGREVVEREGGRCESGGGEGVEREGSGGEGERKRGRKWRERDLCYDHVVVPATSSHR